MASHSYRSHFETRVPNLHTRGERGPEPQPAQKARAAGREQGRRRTGGDATGGGGRGARGGGLGGANGDSLPLPPNESSGIPD
jgi:hypothetical protein